MLFNSLTFVLFFALVLGVYWSPLGWRGRKLWLLVASYVFYAAWNPPFVLLLWLSTIVDWFVAKRLASTDGRNARRGLLGVSLATNLGLLATFKYGDFLLENFERLAATAGIQYAAPPLDIVLPVGISFYTFQTLSYTIDVYRGDAEPAARFVDYALYVTFFPQLVAGPIVRSGTFLPQCEDAPAFDGDRLGWGLTLLTIGLTAKVVLADTLCAPLADTVYGAAVAADVGDAWVGTLAFSAQIFFDFSGYSLCAIGAALCLGFALPDNFHFPYGAIGFSEFWRRWHISLSTWLRDYLYIPLGGNRRGQLRTRVNLALTMLIGGLWHGASWRFVVWGGLHGTYLIVERNLREWWGDRPLPRGTGFAIALFTYGLVCITWVFFRAASFGDAFEIVGAMFGVGAAAGLVLDTTDVVLVLLVNVGLVVGHFAYRDRTLESIWNEIGIPIRVAALTAMLLLIITSPVDDRAFIYFQF